MPLDALITVLTTIFSVAVKVVGFPDQIKSNHKRKTTAGLSTWFVLSAFVSYALWTVHGLLAHDWSLVIGQGLGMLTTGVIIGQIVAYRDMRKRVKPLSAIRLLLPGLARNARRQMRSPLLFRSKETEA